MIKDKNRFEFPEGVKQVIWRNKLYDVGNRRHMHVELYRNGKFVRIASIKHCEQLSKSTT